MLGLMDSDKKKQDWDLGQLKQINWVIYLLNYFVVEFGGGGVLVVDFLCFFGNNVLGVWVQDGNIVLFFF